MRVTDPEHPPTVPDRHALRSVAGEAIRLMNDDARGTRCAEAVIAIMRQAGHLVDDGAVARMTPMQCRVHGYRLAALLHMNADRESQRLAAELLEGIGVGVGRAA